MMFAVILTMAGIPSLPVGSRQTAAEKRDSVTADIDSLALDTIMQNIRRNGPATPDSLLHSHDSLALADAMPLTTDSTGIDTTAMDSLARAIYRHNKAVDDSLAMDSINKSRKNGLEAPVAFSAKDSLVYHAGSGLAYLFGDSHVTYQDMDLTSQNISLNIDSSLVHATPGQDSITGEKTGIPVFKMGSDTYESDTIAFNFKTKKGFIQQVYTEQQDGFLTAEQSKRGEDGVLYLGKGRYTTCDDPHPDFYIAMSRAKVRPGKDVVFGPSYLVVCDVPLPLAIPYGFFPFTKNYSSGFIMPTYGDESDRGFYLREGGYYFAISDKIDLKLLGEIYTKGTWGLSAASNYGKRYKYRGSFYGNYQNTIHGEKNLPDYSKETSFSIKWSHRQDAKAHPYSTFQASVNFATQSYEQNNLTSMYNPQARAQTTRTSSVSYSTTFSRLGLSLSLTTDLYQNMRDSSVNVTLPSMDIRLTQFYPFKRKAMVGNERWYEKISMSYSGKLSNSIQTKEDKLLHSNLVKDWRNGMSHTIPVSATFSLFNYINITPTFTFNDRTYTNKVKRSWDNNLGREVCDTVYGFYNVYDWNMRMGFTTKLYGFYKPWKSLFGNKVQKIRHVFTPTISFSYAPDFSAARYGYWDTYLKTDETGKESVVEYSPYAGSLYGFPSTKGKTGSVSFSVSNNVEMKINSDKDSTGVKKISLIDELGASMSYNFASKVRPLSDLSTSLRLKLSKNYTMHINAVFASYVYEADSVGATPRVSERTTYWSQGKFGRFTGMSQDFRYTLNNEKVSRFFKWLRGERTEKKEDKDDSQRLLDDDELDMDLETNIDRDMEEGAHKAKKKSNRAEVDEDGYMEYAMPWSLTFSYGINMTEDRTLSKFNYHTMRYPYKYTQTLNVSGNVRLSDGWNLMLRSGYDFDYHKLSLTTVSLARDLHCFNMSCTMVLAPYTSYNFSFRCNAATLTDALKYDKRSGNTNSVQWY